MLKMALILEAIEQLPVTLKELLRKQDLKLNPQF